MRARRDPAGREGEVDLEPARQEEDAVRGAARVEVEERDRVEPIGKVACPIGEHIGDGHAVGDAEGQIEIGEAVAAAVRERADDRGSNDARVGRRELEHPVTDTIALLR
jgi:hypothetical protein